MATDGVEEAVLRHLRLLRASPVARTGHLLGTGPVAELEARLCAHYGKRRAVLTANATSALWAAAHALGVRGADVVTTPLSWGGTLAGFLREGARPVFADVDAAMLTLCPSTAAAALTAETRALLAVDLFGVPADDRALRGLADEHGVLYVHDAAQSFGATRSGRPAGSLAHVLIVSFGDGKPLYAGEGGALLTDDDDIYERVLWHTQHPYRHKLELALGQMNEGALHARIHPLAAVWALADFDAALARLVRRRATVEAVLDTMEGVGLIEPLRYRQSGIAPSFARITACWSGTPQPNGLRDVLRAHGLVGESTELGLTPLPGRLEGTAGGSTPAQWPVAAAQCRRRFEVLLD